MLKKNKGTLIITTLIMLLPMVMGLILWNQLPEQIPSHWDINGEVDSWSSKPFAVFVLPAILLAVHWLCILASQMDPKSKNYQPAMFQLVLWICPVISLIINTMVYVFALGYALRVEIIMPLLVGLMFIIVGNLLPKCRQTYTMGIKLPWTLSSEENWNATHRFGGKVWVIGGIATILTAFLGNFWVLIVILAVMCIVPTIYSYLYYRRHEKGESHED